MQIIVIYILAFFQIHKLSLVGQPERVGRQMPQSLHISFALSTVIDLFISNNNIKIQRLVVALGHKRITVNAISCGFDSHLYIYTSRGNKVFNHFISSLWCQGKTINTQCFQNSVFGVVSNSVSGLCLPYNMRDTVLS